jgi:DNA-binding response OmpR family regulator
MEVLLVDDDLESQSIVNTTLRNAGFSVIAVNDGLSGLDAAISDKPELILADFRLLGIDIVDFVRRVRDKASLAETPIILLVRREENYDSLFMQSVGISAIVNKPIDPSALSSEVTKHVTVVQTSALPVDASIGDIRPEGALQVDNTATQKVISALQTDDVLRKNILEVIERISWEVLPGVLEAALPKETIKALIESVVWETVPALAEIEIKKEIKRLQSERTEA